MSRTDDGAPRGGTGRRPGGFADGAVASWEARSAVQPAAADATPIIVYGPLRGGSTLLRLMLDGHPDLACVGESDYMVDHLRRGRDGWEYDVRGLSEDRIFIDGGLTLPREVDGRAALYGMIRQIAERAGGRRPVLVLHRDLQKCAELLPNAPILRLLRDPRDVARSAIGMGWAGNVYFGADTWIRTERAWRAFEEAGHRNPVKVTAYEALVADAEGELRAICAFLRVPFDPGMLAYPERTTYAPPDPSLAEQWRRKLTPRQVALVEARIGDLLDGSGYAPSGAPVRQPGPIERSRLALSNRSNVWRLMIRRYGLLDPVARGLGRRLRIDALERYGTRRMDKTTRRLLK